ncbi:MAG TPA: hypothetical protein PK543_00015 [Candidatus Saccharibacteria bacterium]|nr:hypothetical protein [Candidatus Saccharibacteria bacterium]
MKKNSIIILSVVVLLVLLGSGFLYYSNQAGEKATKGEEQNKTETPAKKDVREVVWEQMSARQKDEIIGTWDSGKVSKITWSEGAVMTATVSKSYVGQEVYVINFPSKLNATIGDVVVFADLNTFNIIGYGLRD